MVSTESLIRSLDGLSAQEVLRFISEQFGHEATFSTSLGYEDQVIAHMIFSQQLAVDVFTLDTGRLFPETYKTLNSTNQRYGVQIKVMYPETARVQEMVTAKGPFSFYDSIDNRKECCFVRKVEPLKRALAGKKCWITGIRASQSGTRENLPMVEWDEANEILKVHPLLHWSLEEVKTFIKENHIPYNTLHDKGFPSIGCQPCTRAVKEGEDVRAGRWWWEHPDSKECGLHE